MNSEKSFCKFLSANDTGATGAHQSGILISKTAMEMLFSEEQLDQDGIPKRTVKIKWQDDFETESCFTYYKSKKELRITKFGRGFPFLNINQTGSLFVFTKQEEEHYSGYFLDTDHLFQNELLKCREYMKLPDGDYSSINPEHLYTLPAGDYAVFTVHIQDETADFSPLLKFLSAEGYTTDIVFAEEIGFQLFKYIHNYYCEIRAHLIRK